MAFTKNLSDIFILPSDQVSTYLQVAHTRARWEIRYMARAWRQPEKKCLSSLISSQKDT